MVRRHGPNLISSRSSCAFAIAWFETCGVAALLTMRVCDLIPNELLDLILRSIAKRCVSKD